MTLRLRPGTLVALAIAAALSAPASAQPVPAAPPTPVADAAPLHVASPDWRDQIIYFLMIDRFNDGDRARNDQGLDEYRPAEEGGYSGGDLKGVIDKLDYIRELGATSVWTTPPFANQTWNRAVGSTGYHGYWPRDFTRVDEHYGTMETYRTLARELHRRNMFLVMDIVVNHVGNFFDYGKDFSATDPMIDYQAVNPRSPTSTPITPPFDMNDPRDLRQRQADIYHWSPLLVDYKSRTHELTDQLGGLDDVNTSDPAVRAAFKAIYGAWIEGAGVDAFRIDTVKYVEPDFFADFLHGPGGIYESARRSGRKDFLVFGEVKENAPPFSLQGETKLGAYLSATDRPGFPSLINFPLQEEMVRVLAAGMPTSALSYRLKAFLDLFPEPAIAANFVDNHDVPRFLSEGSPAALRQAMALMFALPGIPIIYQGDEQGAHDSREAMFAGGYLSPKDRFNTDSPTFGYIKALAALRRAHPALRRGKLELLLDNPTAPGVFALRRTGEGETIDIVLNSADHVSLLSTALPDVAEGSALEPLFGDTAVQRVGPGGRLTMELPARAIRFYRERRALRPVGAGTVPAEIMMPATVPDAPLTAPLTLSSRFRGPDKQLLLVRDGNLSTAQPVPLTADGRWSSTLAPEDLGTNVHFVELYAPRSRIVSPRIAYTTSKTKPDWQVAQADPAGDDKGPGGAYRLPLDPGFDGPQDILGAKVRGGGDVLELELTMRAISDVWLPANGFDHAAFTIFFDFPGAKGAARFDPLNLPMPAGFTWSRAHSVFGWGNALIQPPNEKRGLAPAITVDRSKRTITLTYRASAMGQHDWHGARLYVTSFDRTGEGAFRPITRESSMFAYGGDPDGPKVADELRIDLPKLPRAPRR